MQVVQPDPRSMAQIDDAVIDAVRDVADAEGYRLTKHVTTADLEQEERKIQVTLVRSTSGQQELPLKGGKEETEA